MSAEIAPPFIWNCLEIWFPEYIVSCRLFVWFCRHSCRLSNRNDDNLQVWCRFCRLYCRLLKSILQVNLFHMFPETCEISIWRRHLLHRPPMTATCLNTQNRSDVAVKDLKHSQECAEGILDGLRLICKTSMAGCGWCIPKIIRVLYMGHPLSLNFKTCCIIGVARTGNFLWWV